MAILNGRVPDSELTTVRDKMRLRHVAAQAWRNMQGNARAAGIVLDVAGPAGCYRSWDTQVDMHVHPENYNLSAASVVRLAQPGGSTHGFGWSLDIADWDFGGKRSVWVLANAGRFGFTRTFGAADPNHFGHDGVTVGPSSTGTAGGGTTPIPVPTPSDTLEMEYDMIRIQAPDRGIGLIGPGYYRGLTSNEEVEQSGGIITKHITGNNRQYDLWVAMATGGSASSTPTEAQIRADIGYIRDQILGQVERVRTEAVGRLDQFVTPGLNNLLARPSAGTIDVAPIIAALITAVEKTGVTVDAKAVAKEVESILLDEFASVNANIDDQPTTFTLTPKE